MRTTLGADPELTAPHCALSLRQGWEHCVEGIDLPWHTPIQRVAHIVTPELASGVSLPLQHPLYP